MNELKPIGVFDSGYGGLTVLKEFLKKLPDYDFLYLGDNARTPYGTRSFHIVYEYTLQAVKRLFSMGCHLVILACNTASAKALRTIQQKDLPKIDPERRVLGVIRPIVESLSHYTKNKLVGVLATKGTVLSQSYPIEINKLFPEIITYQEACPMWVPLVENDEYENEGADYFVEKNVSSLMSQNKKIDTVILGCTHYPLLIDKIKKFLPSDVKLISQGEIVADSLIDYLQRHPEIDKTISKYKRIEFLTTDSADMFTRNCKKFLGNGIGLNARTIHLD